MEKDQHFERILSQIAAIARLVYSKSQIGAYDIDIPGQSGSVVPPTIKEFGRQIIVEFFGNAGNNIVSRPLLRRKIIINLVTDHRCENLLAVPEHRNFKLDPIPIPDRIVSAVTNAIFYTIAILDRKGFPLLFVA